MPDTDKVGGSAIDKPPSHSGFLQLSQPTAVRSHQIHGFTPQAKLQAFPLENPHFILVMHHSCLTSKPLFFHSLKESSFSGVDPHGDFPFKTSSHTLISFPTPYLYERINLLLILPSIIYYPPKHLVFP